MPLLPKPTTSPQLQTFAFVPVSQMTPGYTNLHFVAARPAEGNFCATMPVSRDGNCSVFLTLSRVQIAVRLQ